MADRNPIGEATAAEVVALRNKWHTKDHPFFVEFHEGKIGLDALGALMAQHYQHVDRVLPSLGVAIFKATGEARKFMIENLDKLSDDIEFRKEERDFNCRVFG